MSEYEILKEKCDLLWSKLIKIMYPHCYFTLCGKKSEEACHTIKRAKLATRWRLENGLGGCQWHNQWEEQHKDEARALKISILGEEKYLFLENLGAQEILPTLEDLEYIASGLEKELKASGVENVRVRSIREAKRKQAKRERGAAMERYKEKHGGLTPWKIAYRRKKEYLKNLKTT